MEEMNFAEMLEESLKTLHTGEVVNGIVTAVDDKAVYLDLGAKVTGMIEKEQATDDMAADLRTMFKPGDEVRAFVIRVDDGKGVATLSKKRVDSDAGWEVIKAAKESGEIIEAPVTEVVKGGIRVTYAGCKIFVPASLTDTPKDTDLNTLRGTTQRLVITKLDESRKSAIGSIRVVGAAERKEAREAARNAALARLEVGAHVTGVVKSMTTYGAFVDLGGIDGMIHNTELSWKRIKNPSEVVSIGQEIDVYVKSFDAEKGRVSLGYKTEESNPWTIFMNNYKVGDVVKVTVVSMTPFGAFAQIIPGVDGLIHISQIADKKLAHPSDVLKKGEEVEAKIIDINEEAHNVSLSIRALLEKDEDTAEEAPAAEAAEETAAE